MGLTERHWFENEDVPENYEWALEDDVYNSRTSKKPEDSELTGKSGMRMPDREKIIKNLEDCLSASCRRFRPLLLCPFNDEEWNIMRDALALLKEQEAVKPKSKVRHGANAQIQHFCGNCNSMLHGKPKYCSECGKSVKWNECDNLQMDCCI